jgi:uncharacterized protein YjiS (DUF1127 family)
MARGNEATIRSSIGSTTATATPGRDHGSLLGRCLTGLLRWLDRGRQRHALRELDDRLLDDIGVTRAAAEREVATPFWRIGAPTGRPIHTLARREEAAASPPVALRIYCCGVIGERERLS